MHIDRYMSYPYSFKHKLYLRLVFPRIFFRGILLFEPLFLGQFMRQPKNIKKYILTQIRISSMG